MFQRSCTAQCKVCAGPHSYVNCDPALLGEAQKEQLLKLRGQQGSQGAKPDSLRRGDTAKDKAKTKKLEQVREGWWAPTHVEAEVTPGKRASRTAQHKQNRLTEVSGDFISTGEEAAVLELLSPMLADKTCEACGKEAQVLGFTSKNNFRGHSSLGFLRDFSAFHHICTPSGQFESI